MKDNIYLFKSDVLKRKDNTIVYILKDKTHYIPVEQIDTIHCFGETTLNKKLLKFLSSYKIGLFFYNRYGRCVGKFNNTSYRSGKDILLQSEAYLDEFKRNRIILSMEKASIHNSLAVAKYYQKKGYELKDAIFELEAYKKELNNVDTEDKEFYGKVLLLEARNKQTYYSLFDIVLKETPFRFEKRSCFPPANEVNALMSFLYALMYNDVLNAIERSSLIPEISFIHGNSRNNNGGLQYDIADYLKPQIADRLFLRLLREGRLAPDHFYYTSSKSCFINEEGKKIVLDAYHKQLKTCVFEERNGRSYSYKQFYYREVSELAKGIKGDGNYRCAIFRY